MEASVWVLRFWAGSNRLNILLMSCIHMVNQVRAAHILIPDEKKARDIKAKIDAGEDFAELAKKKC